MSPKKSLEILTPQVWRNMVESMTISISRNLYTAIEVCDDLDDTEMNVSISASSSTHTQNHTTIFSCENLDSGDIGFQYQRIEGSQNIICAGGGDIEEIRQPTEKEIGDFVQEYDPDDPENLVICDLESGLREYVEVYIDSEKLREVEEDLEQMYLQEGPDE